MARLSSVTLAHIDIPSNHSIAFANKAARDTWFDGRDKEGFTNLYYNREEQGINVDRRPEELVSYNFGYYINEGGIKIYFRIVGFTYINENNTTINIERDVLMTYLCDSVMQPSFIERSNTPPSTLFDSDVPEIQYHGGFTHTLLDTFGTPHDWGYFTQVTGDHEPETQALFQTEYDPKSFDNSNAATISFLSMFKYFDNESAFQLFVQQYADNGTGDRIVAAGMFPNADVGYSEINTSTRHTAIMTGVRTTKAVSVGSGLNTRIAKDNSSVIIAESGNFGNQIEIPITELSGGSITIVSVSDPISQQRHYGILSGADGDNELKYRITINTGASLPSVNLPYYMAVRNIETDLGAQQTNNLIGGAAAIGSGAVTGAVVGSAFGGVGAIPGAIAGAASAGLATATSAIQNQVSASAALEKAKGLAPTVSGNPTGFGVFANRSIGVEIFLKEPSGSGLQQLTDYYRFFGYSRSRVETPQVKSGTKFYVGNINGHFPGATATDAATIRSLFTTGVWIWANEGAFFSY